MIKEQNDLNVVNEDGLYKLDELNKAQQGKESFDDFQEQFVSKEENEKVDEISDLSSTPKTKKTDNSSNKNNADVATKATGSMSMTLPGVLVSVMGTVAVVGGATGLIKIAPSNDVSMFLSRSTELGFEINGDLDNKSYLMFLSNDNEEYSKEVNSIKQFVFTDLTPNTIYDLTAYDLSVDPMKKVFSSNYMTKAHDAYSSFITNSNITDNLLTFDILYDGNDINFVTIRVYGDKDSELYKYEGSPVDQITVDIKDNTSITCEVKVNGQVTTFEQLAASGETVIPIESVTLDQESIDLRVGKQAELVATVLPENATNKKVVFSSSDKEIVSVNQKGIITAIKEGSAEITVAAVNGDKKDTCMVYVSDGAPAVHVTSITLNKELLEMFTGDKEQLSATVLPEDALNKNVTWSSNNENVATVSKIGYVTAKGAGEAIVSATTVDGGLIASCTVKVEDPVIIVTGVSLDPDSLEINVGETSQLIASVLPTNATNKELIFASSNESVATVDENGLVTAISVGEIIITVESVEGGYKDYCIVTVK